jgi:hypothetical protein
MNCSILSQKVPKFELYKHNDELFNIFYGIFYELWTFAYFDRSCKLEKGGIKLKKNLLLWNYSAIEQFWPFEEISILSHGGHLGYRTAMTDTSLKGNHPRIISAKFGWDWLSSFRGEDFFLRNFFKWPKLLYFKQKVPKFELYKHNDELFNIYYKIFYELWTFAYFDRLCKLEKRGDEIKEKSSPPTLTDTILKGDHTRIISAKFGWDWLSSFREDFFLISSITRFFMNFELLPILTDYAN